MCAFTRYSAQEAMQSRAPGPASPHSPAARLSWASRDALGARNWASVKRPVNSAFPEISGRVGPSKAFLWKLDFLLPPRGTWKPVYHFFFISIQIIMTYSNISMKIIWIKKALFYILVTLFSLQNCPSAVSRLCRVTVCFLYAGHHHSINISTNHVEFY